MEKEFEDYWNKHQKRLILNAPRELREEYIESTRLDSPIDWACFILPVVVGVVLQSSLRLGSEILSWVVAAVVIVVCFAVLQMLKPFLQKKKSTLQVIKNIKQYYYESYMKGGLREMDPWK